MTVRTGRNIHPFPARMAPELALRPIQRLGRNGVVLDPMTGSGTVIQCAAENGHRAIGIDSDPLAVLISTVRTAEIDDDKLLRLFRRIISKAEGLDLRQIRLPWIDEDPETKAFTEFWFGDEQRTALRRIAAVLDEYSRPRIHRDTKLHVDAIRLALSRIIITKESAASLARDTSHSRPHRVRLESDYDVFSGFRKSMKQVRKLLNQKTQGRLTGTTVHLGDARDLRGICGNGQVDLVVTSPPYLNAIDYMRGHRLSLVWLGHKFSDLRGIRSGNIGAERGAADEVSAGEFVKVVGAMGDLDKLPSRTGGMVLRYAEDTYRYMSEIRRVLRRDGKAVLVVGDSCIKGQFVRNSEAVKMAAKLVGLRVLTKRVRELPPQSRYLPTPNRGNALSARMRTENVLTLRRD